LPCSGELVERKDRGFTGRESRPLAWGWEPGEAAVVEHPVDGEGDRQTETGRAPPHCGGAVRAERTGVPSGAQGGRGGAGTHRQGAAPLSPLGEGRRGCDAYGGPSRRTPWLGARPPARRMLPRGRATAKGKVAGAATPRSPVEGSRPSSATLRAQSSCRVAGPAAPRKARRRSYPRSPRCM
jgi:hypothetical protein